MHREIQTQRYMHTNYMCHGQQGSSYWVCEGQEGSPITRARQARVRSGISQEESSTDTVRADGRNWAGKKMEFWVDGGSEPSHMVSATPGKPVGGRLFGNAGERELSWKKHMHSATRKWGQRAVGKTVLGDWHLCWLKPTLDVESWLHKVD